MQCLHCVPMSGNTEVLLFLMLFVRLLQISCLSQFQTNILCTNTDIFINVYRIYIYIDTEHIFIYIS